MNYLAWSNEYMNAAEELAAVIRRIKEQRAHACASQRKELDDKLSRYRSCYRECLQTAELLRGRVRDAA